MNHESGPLLSIDRLSVSFGRPGQYADAVREVSFDIHAGEKLALVGESGSGKSVTALSILQLHDPRQVHYPGGSIRFQGRELMGLAEGELRKIRGRDIAMIFQEPMTSLNPLYSIGEQLMEPLLAHESISKPAARKRMVELLARTGIPEPDKRFEDFPHMLSGGQRQRVMIAMALACSPKLLIADEPTTALDVTIQAQILELLEDLQKEFSMAVLLITHDLNLVRRFADRICVMQQGQIVEQAPVADLFAAPQHAYTRHLLQSQPQRLVTAEEVRALETSPALLEANGINCVFSSKAGLLFKRKVSSVRAVDDAALFLRSGETLGIVGESGSGKTTLGMCLLRLQDCTGHIRFNGAELSALNQRQLRPLRRDFQIVFQDPYSSLSPRLTVEQIVGEGLGIHFPQLDKRQRRERILAIMEEVGLEESMLWRYPHEFSGGQRQRIAIARVVILEPRLILLDEPTSALDVSVQKQVLDLLRDLQQRHGMSYLFITHDLRVIRAMAHRMIVMQSGKVVEAGETEALFEAPQQEYTRALLRASLI
ncbi:MAG: ABC transporter ATP-binding protein [Gammaproteobacteria bacterium]|nr:ABC transporter ATP-binding protein [Gammaproteobacteria bacterium]MBU1730968.1 ABC transporter ATP-binding protein [Gammaproteobacteria bacterium]MBU1893628.1 ABC transporter ATP-binding protein [Gammaproteobacteria bacterium]